MKKTFFIVVLVLCCGLVRAQYVSLSTHEITRLKQLAATDTSVNKYVKHFKQLAERALGDSPTTIDTIHTEGRLKGDPQKVATQKALGDMPKIYALSLTYRLTGDKRYLDKAAVFLSAWADSNQPNGDPIDDTNLDGAIEGYDLIKNDLPADKRKLITGWLLHTGQVEVNKIDPRRTTSFNNWNSHRLKIVGEIGYAINDKDLQQFTVNNLKIQLMKNLNPDGSSWDFKERDALHYHLYDLDPLLKLAIVLQRATGTNYYSYQSATGSSIKKSVDWLLPFATGEKTHQEFVNSNVKFDRDRAKNGEADYKSGAIFHGEAALPTLSLAAYFQPELIQTIQKMANTGQTYANWQLVLNAVEK